VACAVFDLSGSGWCGGKTGGARRLTHTPRAKKPNIYL